MGYFYKKQTAKKFNYFLLVSGLIFFIFSFCGISFTGNIIVNTINELRLQLVLVISIMFLFTLIKKRFFIAGIFALFALFNFYIIVSQNEILVQEYAGQKPKVFKSLVYRMAENHNDFAEMVDIINTSKPELAVLYLNTENIENVIKGYKYSNKIKLNGEYVAIISKFPYDIKQSIQNNQNENIASVLHFPKFKRPIDVIVTANSNPLNLKKMDKKNNIDAIAKFVSDIETPVMIIGGFNTNPWTTAWKGLQDKSYTSQAGLHPDYPAYLPLPLRISTNYIYSSSGISIFETKLLEKTTSDYLPKLFTVAIERKRSR